MSQEVSMADRSWPLPLANGGGQLYLSFNTLLPVGIIPIHTGEQDTKFITDWPA